MNTIKVAAIQLGEVPESPEGQLDAKKINKDLLYGTPEQKKSAISTIASINTESIRSFNFSRMEKLLKQASGSKPDLVVFPELSLTSFFPYLWIEDKKVLSRFFETDNRWRNKIYKLAQKYGVSIAFGYTAYAGNRGKNVFELVTPETEKIQYRYEKVHIPGHEKPEPNETTFQFEKKYFAPGDSYPVWTIPFKDRKTARVGMIVCHDRRYNAPYLMMGLKNVQILLNGFNTPFNFVAQDTLDKHVYEFHYLPLQAQAITEGIFIISVARAGTIFGHRQIAGSCIISPYGTFLAKTEHPGEAVITAELNLDWCREVKAQKYYGDRSRPEVLKAELDAYLQNGNNAAVDRILSKLDSF